MTPDSAAGTAADGVPAVLAFAPRERVRTLMRRAFPARRGQLRVCRTAAELKDVFGGALVDVVVVDLANASDDTWAAASCAREYPCTPFFGIVPFRVADAPTIARSAALEFADVLADSIDDGVLHGIVTPAAFTARFAAALAPAHRTLGLTSPTQHRAWTWIIGRGGRPVRTDLLASVLGVTREHLSRSFAAAGAPNLKRIIDLVRILAAAELAKCPGYDTADVSRVLHFASTSHLSSTAERVCGASVASLSRLRAGDIIERFRQGRGRSRSGKARSA